MTGSTVTVRVRDGWGVAYRGQQASGGGTLDVPPDLAAEWLAAGWVEKVQPKARKAT